MGYQDRDYYQYDQDVDLRPSWNQRSAVTQLIVINVAVFFVNMLVGDVTAQQQGWVNELMMLRPDTLYQPWNWWKTLTYAFAHSSSGITHLLFNMLSLYFMGRSVEARYGRREFLRIYILSALFCGVVWMVIRGISGTGLPVLGASGAVLCISMLFVYNYPNATVYFLVFPMPAWVLGILFVLTNFVSQPGTGVAYDIHLLGILFATMYFFLRWNFSAVQDPQEGVLAIKKWWARRKFKVHSPEDRELPTEQLEAREADRILEKIHASGKDSLTSREKKFMERYSQSVRKRKELES